MQAIHEFVPEQLKLEYYVPLYLYHDRWQEVEYKDFLPYFLRYSPSRNERRGATLVTDWSACNNPAMDIENAGICTMSDESIYWYERLKDLCDENNVQLLFTVVPYECPVGSNVGATVEQMRLFNATEKWCKENGVDYISLFDYIDEMEFDYSTDMQDVSHVNVLGALKVTDQIGKYLNSDYELEDYRSNAEIADSWEAAYQRYVTERDAATAECLEKQK